MAKTPGLMDLLALVPAADIARAAKALGLDPEALTKRLLALDSTGISTRLVDTAEYKRRRTPPGVRVTPKAFGKDRRLPITNRYRG